MCTYDPLALLATQITGKSLREVEGLRGGMALYLVVESVEAATYLDASAHVLDIPTTSRPHMTVLMVLLSMEVQEPITSLASPVRADDAPKSPLLF